ncbi:MAG: DUF2079 domain-containing protein [Chloroflexota bacterium]
MSTGRLRKLRRRLVPVALTRVIAARWTELATYAASLAGVVAFARFALLRHEHFQSQAYDLGFFDQVVWNTSRGHLFATSFESYNFLGVHFQPVLLIFAAMYRLGAGVELLLIVQAIFVAAAAVPLYYAMRRLTSSSVAALAMALAFLLTTSLHNALDFDFHPEMLGFFFAFLALYLLAAQRPLATIVSLLPLLTLKEDMPLILGAFAVLLFVEGHRWYAGRLMAIAIGWMVVIAFVTMPLIRWGDAGLTARYGYLSRGSSALSLVPNLIWRGAQQLQGAWESALPHLLPAFVLALFAPLAAVLVLPALVFHSLSIHDPQAHLDLHYVMMPLALSFIGAAIGLRSISRGDGVAGWTRRLGTPRFRVAVAAGAMLAATALVFWMNSPYSPQADRSAPDAAHVAVLEQALRLIPGDASVAAQSTVLPHASQRAHVFEFPIVDHADYAIIDSNLSISSHERDDGYDAAAQSMPSFEQIFSSDGVRVFRRLP